MAMAEGEKRGSNLCMDRVEIDHWQCRRTTSSRMPGLGFTLSCAPGILERNRRIEVWLYLHSTCFRFLKRSTSQNLA